MRKGDATMFQTSSSNSNPVCSKCGTVYNKAEVIRQMKEASPNFDMLRTVNPITKFKCIKCGEAVVIDLHED
jgi:ribosomal protein S27AE